MNRVLETPRINKLRINRILATAVYRPSLLKARAGAASSSQGGAKFDSLFK